MAGRHVPRLATGTLAAFVACFALFAGSSRAAGEIDVAGELGIETWAVPGLPNDPNRCVGIQYVEFAPVEGAGQYVAVVFNMVLQRNQTFTAGPTSFPDDEYAVSTGGLLHVFRAPEGKHRMVLGVGSRGDGCNFTSGFTLVSLKTTVQNVPPTASFARKAREGQPLTIDFDAAASSDPDSAIASYAWDFGDGQTGTGEKPSHTYGRADTYRVKLTVTDTEGASGSTTKDVVVTASGLTVAGELVGPDGADFVRPGDTATLRAHATAQDTVDELVLEAVVPTASKLAQGSITGGGVLEGSAVRWRFTNVAQTPEVQFAVTVDGLAELPDDLGRLESEASARATRNGTEESVETTFSIELRRSDGLVVNSTADGADETTADGMCSTGADVDRNGTKEPECTLRAAIDQANSNPGPDTITFDIPSAALTGGQAVISPGGAGLPPLAGPASLDATTQPTGLVIVQGGSNSATGLTITGTDVVLRGLVLRFWTRAASITGNAQQLFGNDFQGDVLVSDSTGVVLGSGTIGTTCAGDCNRVWQLEISRSTGTKVAGNEARTISVTGSTNVTIDGNRLASGTDGIVVRNTGGPVAITANDIDGSANAVKVEDSASGVLIGGTTGGNRIRATVALNGDDNIVRGNTISGSGAWGVFVAGDRNRIGGLAAGEGNTIEGFGFNSTFATAGIQLQGAETKILGNLIGVRADGSAPMPNWRGVHVGERESAAAPDTLIEGNVISGNAGWGVVQDDGERLIIRRNIIGADPTGTRAVPNEVGVLLRDFASAPSLEDNVISGNEREGVAVLAKGATLRGNIIGADAGGTRPVGNGTGIRVAPDGAPAAVAQIGGPAAADRNIIAFNEKEGVVAAAWSGARVLANSIHSNGGLGIDLTSGDAFLPDGVTPNDPGDADEGLQNFPVLSGASLGTDGLLVTGSLGAVSTGTYTVEVFTNTVCDPSGYGEGKLLGGSAVTTAGGPFPPVLVSSPPADARYVTATTTGPQGTSEFSWCIEIGGGGSGRTLGAAAPAGSTHLEVDSSGLVGKVVGIGSGTTFEKNYGLAPGSLVLARPTRFAHAAGEPVEALDDTLFLTVDKALLTLSSKLPDLAALSGKLRAIAGRSVACGEDVTLTLNGTAVAQRVPGTRFVRESAKRCVFVAKTENGIGRFELDLGKGTWNAQVIRKDLEKLSNPVEVGLTIGDDSGSERVRFTVLGTGKQPPPPPKPAPPPPPKPKPGPPPKPPKPKPAPPKPAPPKPPKLKPAPPKPAPPKPKPKPASR